MKFKLSNYQLDLIESNKLYKLILYNGFVKIFTIKFDIEYMLALYGFLYQMYINTTPFEIIFPQSSITERFKLSCYYNRTTIDDSESTIVLEFTRENITGQYVEYRIDMENDLEELSDLLSLFEEYTTTMYFEDEMEGESLNMIDLYYNRRRGRV